MAAWLVQRRMAVWAHPLIMTVKGGWRNGFTSVNGRQRRRARRLVAPHGFDWPAVAGSSALIARWVA
jgi:hypothetical protein